MFTKINHNSKIIGFLLIIGNIGSIVAMYQLLVAGFTPGIKIFETLAPLLLAVYYFTYTKAEKRHIFYLISFTLLSLSSLYYFYESCFIYRSYINNIRIMSFDQASFCIFCIVMIVVKFKSSIPLSFIAVVLLFGAMVFLPIRQILLGIHPLYILASLIKNVVLFLVWNFERSVTNEKRRVKKFESKLIDINKAYQAGMISEDDYLRQKSTILNNL